MKKKLLGLTAALGITALASWACPAVATDLLPCTARVCFGTQNQNMLCRCLQAPNKIITCASFFQGGCS